MIQLIRRYLASGDMQDSLAFSYRISPSSVSNIIKETLDAIWDSLVEDCMHPPDENKWRSIAENFWTTWQFPHCIGAVDGKHVKIRAPPKTGTEFFNYKGYFSIVLLAIVDAQYKFVAVDIGAKGSQSDGGILKNSAFGKKIAENAFHIPEKEVFLPMGENLPFYILGDEAFPLQMNIMRPYPGRKTDKEQRVFNYRLSRARRVVENAFGILSNRFRIYHTTINTSVEVADKIVKATVVLHNFLIMRKDHSGMPTCSNDVDGEIPAINPLDGVAATGSNNYSKQAADIRNSLKAYFNGEGSVPWQEARVMAGYHPNPATNNSI